MNAPGITDPRTCLVASPIIDSDHASIAAYTARRSSASDSTQAKAVALYYAIRDGIRYDPYSIDLTPAGLRASQTLANGRGWCVSKAVLLSACCRAAGIPAALGFADVQNHLSTERLRRTMGTDIFYWHGYTSILLNGRWVKATPAFNRELCDRFRILPLEFNGREDSIFHPFDADGQQHMEYLAYRGEFPDVPVPAMEADFMEHYPGFMQSIAAGDFDREVTAEARTSD